MYKQQLRNEIIQNLIHPRRFSFTVVLSELSLNEFMLMASFLSYEKEFGNYITVNELASRMEVTVPAVSRSLRKLEERGLIRRVSGEECRRNTFVKISPKGKELFEQNKEAIEYMVDKIIDALTPEEIEASIAFNKKIASIVDRECKIFLTEKQEETKPYVQ